jgi:beta-glucanase (GH16 family)
MNRRRMMLMTGIGMLSAAIPIPEARANPASRVSPPAAPPGGAAQPTYLFHDEFDGPAGSAPDPSKWTIARFREPIKNPVFWDRPENLGQYRDDRRNVFLDGNSNLVLRATKEGNPDSGAGIAGTYFSGKVQGTWWGGINTTWEARIKFNCLTAGCWPAWWLSNDDPVVGGEVDLVEWYGNNDWPSGTTVHARPDGTSFATQPVGVDGGWHRWRVTWNDAGMYFWEDYVDGAQPYFTVPANSIDDWPFNFPDYRVFPVLNLAVSGSGGRDPRPGTYPADMLIDWVRVW